MPELPSQTESLSHDFFGHLRELRRHILRMLVYYFIVAIPLVYFSQDIFNTVAQPMLATLGGSRQLISTQIIGTVFVPLKLALFIALLVTAPLIFYELWKFVVPGLYPNEIQRTRPVLFFAVLFFYIGCAFAFFGAMPLMFQYFDTVTPEGVQYVPDISNYFDFLFVMFIAFGVAFEVPVACYLMIKLKILNVKTLAKSRPYFIVSTAVITAIITPPDAISMLLVLIPVVLLFEITLLFLKIFINDESKSNEPTS